jgi:peptidoglycan/xylan/chitin deacetylase (PgdA/CDA1 family)
MHSHCTVIMYHYVRDLKHSRYPEIKGLELELFKEQIAYLKKHYSLIKVEDLIAAMEANEDLAPNAALLTFDDAYIDHYLNVFPVLERNKIQGAFYAPVKTITENVILDVNKIHFILAAVDNKQLIIDFIYAAIDKFRTQYQLDSNENYFNKLAISNRYDTKEVIYIKRILQLELPELCRKLITNELFSKFVSADEKSFSRELYMNIDQVTCMQRNGMHIGAHGNDHYWLGSLSKQLQEAEIDKSIDFIKSVGGSESNWTMSYPYGNYNQDTLDILKDRKCKLSFTTEVDIADTTKHTKLKLPRLDTNDIPKDQHAPVNSWWEKSDTINQVELVP